MSEATDKLLIWMLDDGIPGHWSMTDGLVRLIAAQRPVRAERIAVRWRWGGARQLFQRLERIGLSVPAALVKLAVALPSPPTGAAPRLIVSRGGGTLFLNAWLARRHHAANVFIGTLRGMPTGLFRAVVLQRDGFGDPPYFAMPLLPSRIDPLQLPREVADFPWRHGRPQDPIASLFLGGDGSGYRYATDDWLAIGRGMRRLYDSFGVRWCVTSSRRTPAEAEALIRAEVPADALHETCWWQAGDRRPCIEAFLGATEYVFCTEDSMSMLEECIASGRPVVSLGKPDITPSEAFGAFLERRQRAGRLRRVTIEDFAAALPYPVTHAWQPVPANAMADSTGQLLAILGL